MQPIACVHALLGSWSRCLLNTLGSAYWGFFHSSVNPNIPHLWSVSIISQALFFLPKQKVLSATQNNTVHLTWQNNQGREYSILYHNEFIRLIELFCPSCWLEAGVLCYWKVEIYCFPRVFTGIYFSFICPPGLPVGSWLASLVPVEVII